LPKHKTRNRIRKQHPFKWGFTIFFGLFLLIAVNHHNHTHRDLIDELFCNTQSDLYMTMKNSINSWEEEFPDTFEALNGNDQIFFLTPTEQKYVVHAVYWTTENSSPIFFVPIETKLRRMLEIGKYGLFYAPSNELPVYGVGEMIHLDNGIYCYRGDVIVK